MKKIIVTALTASIIVAWLASTVQNVSAMSDTVTTSTDYTAEEKKAIERERANKIRVEYYTKYKAKGYDVDLITPELRDSALTTDAQFWEALKQVQNNHEVPDRRAYVAKLKGYGYDVSGFTEEVIWDSGKFWELVKLVETNKKPVTETKKEEAKAKVETKKEEVKTKVEEKKTQVVSKVSAAQAEKLKTLMKARIAKLPADSRDATLARLETALKSAIESARAKNSKVLASRYEVLLAVVQEEMNNIDDEALINSLFQ